MTSRDSVPWGLFAVAWAAALWTIAPGLHGLDSAEIALSSAAFGVGHPPGQVPQVLMAAAFQLLPVGDLAFRANLFSYACTLISALLAVRLASGWARGGALSPFAAGAVGIVGAACPFVFQQMARTEVYALSAALSLGALILAGSTDARARAGAAFLWGLALLNHPVVAAFALPFVAYRCGRSFVFAALPCLLLAYFPIRATAPGAWNFGHAETFSLFRAFVRGDLYAAAAGTDSLAHNVREWAWALVGSVPLGLLALAGIGFAGLARHRRGEAVLLASGAALLLFSLVRQGNYWPENPDAQGYQAVLVWFAVALAGAALAEGLSAGRARRMGTGVLLGLWCVQAALAVDPRQYARDFLSSRQMAYLFSETEGRPAVHHASFFTYSLLSYGRAVERRRSDLDVRYRGDRFYGASVAPPGQPILGVGSNVNLSNGEPNCEPRSARVRAVPGIRGESGFAGSSAGDCGGVPSNGPTLRNDRLRAPGPAGAARNATQDAWELLLARDAAGKYVLAPEDRARVAAGMDCALWFCGAPAGPAFARNYADFIAHAARDLPARQEFAKEPFVLNSIVRLLAARVGRDPAAASAREKELFFLFPGFAEYHRLHPTP